MRSELKIETITELATAHHLIWFIWYFFCFRNRMVIFAHFGNIIASNRQRTSVSQNGTLSTWDERIILCVAKNQNKIDSLFSHLFITAQFRSLTHAFSTFFIHWRTIVIHVPHLFAFLNNIDSFLFWLFLSLRLPDIIFMRWDTGAVTNKLEYFRHKMKCLYYCQIIRPSVNELSQLFLFAFYWLLLYISRREV